MTSWKLTLACTKAEAEAVATLDPFADWETPPVLLANEPDEHMPDVWEIIAYSEAAPTPALIAALHALVPSAYGGAPQIEQLDDEDWVTLSQQGLTPITAGRFYVHPPHHPPMPGKINFLIDAGLAFGTGQHATTHGCLFALDALAEAGGNFANIVDIGTGTGLLAFAALRLWADARVMASDIDPIAIEVSAANARINDVPLGAGAGTVDLHVADGVDDAALRARAPYDLVIANILAQPLIDMAADIVAVLADGGTLILSGLLVSQIDMVCAAYESQALTLKSATPYDDWAVLMFDKSRLAAGA